MSEAKVKFIGCSEAQHEWGNHTGDYTKLKIGKTYTVREKEIHSWHTKIYLEEIAGSFNSVCFE